MIIDSGALKNFTRQFLLNLHCPPALSTPWTYREKKSRYTTEPSPSKTHFHLLSLLGFCAASSCDPHSFNSSLQLDAFIPCDKRTQELQILHLSPQPSSLGNKDATHNANPLQFHYSTFIHINTETPPLHHCIALDTRLLNFSSEFATIAV